MKWLLALFCFSSVSAALVTPNLCKLGATHACKDVETAKKCSSLPTCLREWKDRSLKSVTGSTTCVICKIVVQGLKTMVKNKKTQEEIKDLAEKACDLMKNEKTAYEVCNTVVYLYLPEVLEMINSEIDVDTICKLLHLCGTSKPTRLTAMVQQKRVRVFEQCAECQLAVVALKDYLKSNVTKKELIEFFSEDICPRMSSSLSPFCDVIVRSEAPKLLAILEHLMDPESLCAFLTLCPKPIKKSLMQAVVIQVAKSFRDSGIECQLCHTAVNKIRDTIREASFQQQIKTFLETEVCTRLGSLEKECQRRVTEYLPFVIKFAINELDPNNLCKVLELCSTAAASSLTQPIAVTNAKASGAFPLCVLCEFIMHKVESMIGTNRSEAAITSALEDVCSVLPKTIRTDCDKFMSKYASELAKLLVEKVAPTLVCTALHLCVGETENSMVFFAQKLRGQGNVL